MEANRELGHLTYLRQCRKENVASKTLRKSACGRIGRPFFRLVRPPVFGPSVVWYVRWSDCHRFILSPQHRREHIVGGKSNTREAKDKFRAVIRVAISSRSFYPSRGFVVEALLFSLIGQLDDLPK